MDTFGSVGVLVDQTAPTGAPYSTGLVWAWDNNQEKDVVKALKDYEKQYGQRAFYRMHNLELSGNMTIVADKINGLRTRLNTIESENNEPNIFYFPYKRNNNQEAINVIKHAIDNLDDALLPIDKLTPMLGGEKINLRQNLEMSMETLSRRLDSIESNIDNSKVLSSYLK